MLRVANESNQYRGIALLVGCDSSFWVNDFRPEFDEAWTFADRTPVRKRWNGDGTVPAIDRFGRCKHFFHRGAPVIENERRIVAAFKRTQP